jgi:hypothetical protein
MSEIVESQKDVENEINRIAKLAIENSKLIAAQKGLFVNSALGELRRKLRDLGRLREFIEIQKNASGPLSYLQTFDRQKLILSQYEGNDDLPDDVPISSDIHVVGSLQVEAGPESEPTKRKLLYDPTSPIKSNIPPSSSKGNLQDSNSPPSQSESVIKKQSQKQREHPVKERSKGIKTRLSDTSIQANEIDDDYPKSVKIIPNIQSLLSIAKKKEQKTLQKGLNSIFHLLKEA